MENNRRNKTITLTVIGIIVLLIVLVGATYAYFSARSKVDTQTINTAKVDLLVEVDPAATHIENIKPTVWYQEDIDEISFDKNSNNEDIVKIPIKVTNNSTIDVNFDLNLQAKNLTLKEEDTDGNKLEGGSLSDIKYKLASIDKSIFGTYYRYESVGDLETPDYKHKLMFNQSLKKGQSTNYTLFIYIADTGGEQNKLQGITFDVEISANTTNPTSRAGEKLADAIRKDYEIKDRKPSYKTYPVYDSFNGSIKENSFFLEDNGLFKMQNNNGNDIYYFRKSFRSTKQNNLVAFGTINEGVGIGFPYVWQILRINDDDSVTLILDFGFSNYWRDIIPSNAVYSSDGNTKYEGSNVQKVLNEAYDKMFTDEEKAMIQETEFCNDTNYDAVLKRLNKDNPEPTLECSEENKVNAYIGLLTADEAILSGILYGKSIYSSSSSIRTWTMTATSENSIAFSDTSSLFSYETTNNNTVLPVITIKPNTKLLDSLIYEGQKIPSQYRTYIIGPEE